MVKIDGVDYTRYAVLPIQLQYARDESLNQGVLTLKNIDREIPFEPASLVEIDGERWLVGADNVRKINYYKNKFQHEIVLTEETKLLEKYFVDSCTFTHTLFKDFVAQSSVVPVINVYPYNSGPGFAGFTIEPKFKENDFGFIGGYITPLEVGSSFTFKKFTDIVSNGIGAGTTINIRECRMVVSHNLKTVYDSGYISSYLEDFTTILKSGRYSVLYEYADTDRLGGGVSTKYFDVRYDFEIVEELKPVRDRKYTITNVIEKLLYLAEIQRKGNYSRFSLNNEQALKYNEIEAPEMSISNSTLREALNVVGGYIHAEVRLDNGVIYFDEYSTNENAVIKKRPVVESLSQSIEQFCSEIESNAQNLIPDDKEQNGNIVEPYLFGYITPRAETGKVEVTDATAFIKTRYPIHKLIRLEMGYLPDNTQVGDITDYVVEKTVYDILSSYTDNPKEQSKAYHIYWQQGQSGITGLAWEQESAISQVFEKNAITNIINDKLGTSYDDANINITNLQFRITYIPIINARVKQVKPTLSGNKKRIVNAYNQSAYKISSTQYGENMKGVVSRLGNIEKIRTYVYNKGEELPKLASRVEDDYIISAIKIDKQHNHSKVTLGLSKRFNRQNQFVGISNEQRFYEISEKNAVERYSLYEDFAILSRNNIEIEQEEKDRSIITDDMLSAVRARFKGVDPTEEDMLYMNEISNAVVELQNADGTQASEVKEISLPVISYSFGNSACYSFDFENNYGAGSYIASETSAGKKLQMELRYPNQLGEFEFMGIKYYWKQHYIGDYGLIPSNYEDALEIGLNLPKIVVPEGVSEFSPLINTLASPLRIKKDNRENIHFSYQIHCLTDDENIIVGSGLSKTFGVAGWSLNQKAVAYVLDRKIGEFENTIINLQSLTGIDVVTEVVANEKKLKIDNITPNTSGKSLVVVNADNNELLFAINEDITALEEVEMPSIYFRHKIYTE